MQINRSSQAEGAFGVIKQDMDYERVRRKGLENVSCECMLVCLEYNIRKFFTLIAGKGKIDCWIAPDGLVAELPKTPKMEKIIKKLQKKRGCCETSGFATAPMCKKLFFYNILHFGVEKSLFCIYIMHESFFYQPFKFPE